MARFRNADWNLSQTTDGRIGSWNDINAALLMDLRDELQKLNALLGCTRFIKIPTTLNRIAKNTTKRKRK